MLKAKGKVVSLLTACLTAIFALVLGFAALFAPTPITTASAESVTYEKVTSAPADWSGEYLIVYEGGNVAFNGSLTTLDATSNTVSVTISDSKITATDAINAATFTINDSGHIKSASGYYIGQTSNANGLKSNMSTTYTNTISFNADGSVNIVSSGAYLRYNSASGQYRFRYYKSSSYTAQQAICLYKKVEATACDHEGKTLTWVYDNGEHYQKCQCGAEIEGSRAACSSFNPYYESQGNGTHIVGKQCTLCNNKTPTGTVDCSPNIWGEWNTADGVHTRTTTCTNCGGEIYQSANCSTATWGEWNTVDGVHTRTDNCDTCGAAMTESGECNFSAPTIEKIEGETQHKEIGTCLTCGKATEALVDCTLTYENVSNDDKTHNMTSYCEVCEQSITTENVACTFGEGVVDEVNWTETFTCQYCEYSYAEDLPTCTVTYVVPNGIDEIEQGKVAENYSIVLPTADPFEGYTFVGWTTAELDEKTEVAPEYFAAESNYTVTEDLTLYALYSYAEGTGAWTKVTDASTLAEGKQIIITANGTAEYALSTNQKSSNRGATTITKNGDTLGEPSADVQIITLEAGTVEGTFAFNVGNGYLFAGSSSGNQLKTQSAKDNNSSWSINISSGNATITAPSSSNRNLWRYNPNNGSPLFACYATTSTTGTLVSIYMKDGATYYVTSFNTCAHANTTEDIEPATCTESGSRTVTCLDCDAVLEAEIIPALGHNFVDDVCETCGNVDPASIVYNGSFYLGLSGMYAGEKDGNYYKLFAFTPDETIDTNYVFRFVKNGENYDMYYGNKKVETVTIETQEDYTVRIYNGEGKILSHNTDYTTYQRMGFYATSSNYPAAITLTALTSISTASLSIGESLTMNYYVTTSADLTDAVMYFTFNNETYPVDGELQSDGRYVFTLNKIAPQYMGKNISAELKLGDFVLDTKEEYSVKQYAQNKLKDSPSDELKQLLTDLLHYGVAAQNYKNENNLSLDDIENLGTASVVEPTEDDKMVIEKGTGGTAYFTGASVWFDFVNKLCITISTTENVSLKINGTFVEVTDTTIYVEGITATEFGNELRFELYQNDVLMQTLYYNINSYAYSMKDDATMGELALALYRYGASASAYAKAVSNNA